MIFHSFKTTICVECSCVQAGGHAAVQRKGQVLVVYHCTGKEVKVMKRGCNFPPFSTKNEYGIPHLDDGIGCSGEGTSTGPIASYAYVHL